MAAGIDFSQYKALSFDCYGTLIDWEAGITAWARAWQSETGAPVSAEQFLADFAKTERVVQSERPSDRYPLILADVGRRIAASHGLQMSEAAATSFGQSVGDWPAFADSTETLRSLRERFKLVILSNVDRASFARSQETLAVAFDAIITAEDVGSYKPDPQNFDTLLATIDGMGIPKHALLHVGESLFHDIVPATRDGIDVVWIDRGGASGRPRASGSASGDIKPLATFPSMKSFADAALLT